MAHGSSQHTASHTRSTFTGSPSRFSEPGRDSVSATGMRFGAMGGVAAYARQPKTLPRIGTPAPQNAILPAGAGLRNPRDPEWSTDPTDPFPMPPELADIELMKQTADGGARQIRRVHRLSPEHRRPARQGHASHRLHRLPRRRRRSAPSKNARPRSARATRSSGRRPPTRCARTRCSTTSRRSSSAS